MHLRNSANVIHNNKNSRNKLMSSCEHNVITIISILFRDSEMNNNYNAHTILILIDVYMRLVNDRK